MARARLSTCAKTWAESKAALEESIKLDPDYAPQWAYLAEDELQLGDFKAGLAAANRAVELGPSDPKGYCARAFAYYAQRNYEGLLSDATRILELEPEYIHGHLLRGDAFKLLGRQDEADREYALEPDRKALETSVQPMPK